MQHAFKVHVTRAQAVLHGPQQSAVLILPLLIVFSAFSKCFFLRSIAILCL